MKAAGYRGVPELIRTYCEKGPEFVEWMESMGFKWHRPLGHSGAEAHRVPRSHYAGHNPGVYQSKTGAPRSFGLAWTTVWLKKLEELDADPHKHRMRKIYRQPDGPRNCVAVTPEIVNIKVAWIV